MKFAQSRKAEVGSRKSANPHRKLYLRLTDQLFGPATTPLTEAELAALADELSTRRSILTSELSPGFQAEFLRSCQRFYRSFRRRPAAARSKASRPLSDPLLGAAKDDSGTSDRRLSRSLRRESHPALELDPSAAIGPANSAPSGNTSGLAHPRSELSGRASRSRQTCPGASRQPNNRTGGGKP